MGKLSFGRIRRLLEVSEQECHCKVLLTPENISVVRHNPAPYNLLVIPRPLSSDVVEGEHFVVVDLRRLVSRGASSSRGPTVEASSRVQGVGSASGASTSSSESSSSSPPAPSRGTRRGHPERPPLPVQVPGPAPRVVKIMRKGAPGRHNAPGSKGEDFMPWVTADSEEPRDLEEEERRERMTGLLDRYAARKRKRQVISNNKSDPALVHTVESSLPATDGQFVTDRSSGDQAIIIPCSPELELTGGAEPDGAGRSESNEGDPAPRALQVIPPLDRGEEQPSKSKYMRSGLPKPNRSDQVITQNYLPPRGPEPLRVEILALGVEEVKDILRRWEPFHRGASAADWLDNLYPHIYRVSVISRGMGLREDYSVTLPAFTPKEDFLQIIDDGIQVRNRNFV